MNAKDLELKIDKVKACLKQTVELKKFMTDDCARMRIQLRDLEKELAKQTQTKAG